MLAGLGQNRPSASRWSVAPRVAAAQCVCHRTMPSVLRVRGCGWLTLLVGALARVEVQGEKEAVRQEPTIHHAGHRRYAGGCPFSKS